MPDSSFRTKTRLSHFKGKVEGKPADASHWPRKNDASSRPSTGAIALEGSAPVRARGLDPTWELGSDRRRRRVVPTSVWFTADLRGSEQELLCFLGAHNGVAVLQWPRDAGRVDPLSRVGLPRLLLVHPSSNAWPGDGPLQKVLPFSADNDEIYKSLVLLAERAAERRSKARRPFVDERGCMRTPEGRVHLPPVALRLARALLADFGQPVGDDTLVSDARCPSLKDRALQGHLARLCQLINPLGLEVAMAREDHHVMRWCA